MFYLFWRASANLSLFWLFIAGYFFVSNSEAISISASIQMDNIDPIPMGRFSYILKYNRQSIWGGIYWPYYYECVWNFSIGIQLISRVYANSNDLNDSRVKHQVEQTAALIIIGQSFAYHKVIEQCKSKSVKRARWVEKKIKIDRMLHDSCNWTLILIFVDFFLLHLLIYFSHKIHVIRSTFSIYIVWYCKFVCSVIWRKSSLFCQL